MKKKRITKRSVCRALFNLKTLSVVFFLLLTLILEWICGSIEGKLSDQRAAIRWEGDLQVSQISCFFSNQAGVTLDTIRTFEHELDDNLKLASIENPSENPNARMWADTYCMQGKVSVTMDRINVTLDAIGVGGDYFLFHNMNLINGSYFQESDYNHDYIVLDQDASWKLFGSYDAVGMTVDINSKPYLVVGIVENPKGKLYEKAGLGKGRIYMSYDAMAGENPYAGIGYYEIVMPNPVKGYALQYVKDHFSVDETQQDVIDNTARFGKLSLLKHLKELPDRAMNGKAIIYPYFENVARVKEDRLSKLVLAQAISLGISLIIVIACIVKWWKHKTFNAKTVVDMIRNWCYDKSAKHYQNRLRRKEMRKHPEKSGSKEKPGRKQKSDSEEEQALKD